MSTVLLYKVSLSTVCYGHITYKVDTVNFTLIQHLLIRQSGCEHLRTKRHCM